jgi:hypothetical protein
MIQAAPLAASTQMKVIAHAQPSSWPQPVRVTVPSAATEPPSHIGVPAQ